MEGLKTPKPFTFDGNVAERWKQRKEEFEWYLVATESDTKPEKVRAGILLHCLGPKGKEIYNTFTFDTAEDRVKYTKIKEKLEAYCVPRINLTLQRFKFLTYRQGGETFDEFVTELKKLSSTCELDTLRDSLIRDMIIIGTGDRKLQERLLRKTDITLDDAIKEGQTPEATKKEVLNSSDKGNLHTDEVKFRPKFKHIGNKMEEVRSKKVEYKSNLIKNCQFCPYQHQRGKCPAYRKTCIVCKGLGHFAK